MNVRIILDSPNQRRRAVRLGSGVLVPLFVLILGLIGSPSEVWGDDWGFAWEIGAITATPRGNPFVFRLTAARSYSEEFSIGPSFYLTPYGDNAMYSGSLNAQFHVGLENFRISPFFGLGIAHRRSRHDNDTAFLIPMGSSVETPIGEKLYLVGTFSINLHDGITIEGEKDGSSIGLTAGISYSP